MIVRGALRLLPRRTARGCRGRPCSARAGPGSWSEPGAALPPERPRPPAFAACPSDRSSAGAHAVERRGCLTHVAAVVHGHDPYVTDHFGPIAARRLLAVFAVTLPYAQGVEDLGGRLRPGDRPFRPDRGHRRRHRSGGIPASRAAARPGAAAPLTSRGPPGSPRTSIIICSPKRVAAVSLTPAGRLLIVEVAFGPGRRSSRSCCRRARPSLCRGRCRASFPSPPHKHRGRSRRPRYRVAGVRRDGRDYWRGAPGRCDERPSRHDEGGRAC